MSSTYSHTIEAEDVGRSISGFGVILTGDVGKRVYKVQPGNFYQVENDEQLAKRRITNIIDKVGCSDLPDALLFMAEQGPATYGMDLVCETLRAAANRIEALENDLRLSQLAGGQMVCSNHLRFDVV